MAFISLIQFRENKLYLEALITNNQPRAKTQIFIRCTHMINTIFSSFYLLFLEENLDSWTTESRPFRTRRILLESREMSKYYLLNLIRLFWRKTLIVGQQKVGLFERREF